MVTVERVAWIGGETLEEQRRNECVECSMSRRFRIYADLGWSELGKLALSSK